MLSDLIANVMNETTLIELVAAADFALSKLEAWDIDWVKLNSYSPDYDKDYVPVWSPETVRLRAALRAFKKL